MSTRAKLRFRVGEALFYLAIAVAFACFICWRGTPALRHDWIVAPSRPSFIAIEYEQFFGWTSLGIGAPRILPSDYIEQLAVTAVGWLVGSWTTVFAVAFGIAAFCCAAIRAACSALGSPRIAAGALAAVFLFNPWAYTCVVAGHLTMIASAASLAPICALALTGTRGRLLPLWVLGAMLQFQLLLLALPLLAVHLIRLRDYRQAVLAALVLVPLFVAPFLAHNSVAQIPVTIDWLRAQAVDVLSGFLLSGYSAAYARTDLPVVSLGSWLLLLTVGASILVLAVRGREGKRALCLAIAAIAIVIFASGVNGPAKGAMTWAFMHIRALAIFREPYDLIGAVTAVYVLLIAIASRASSAFTWSTIAVGAAYIFLWFAFPVAAFWVPLERIPHVNLGCAPGSRFALSPWRVPLSYHGHGSGLDPDAAPPCVAYVPLNVPLPQFPIDRALAEADRHNYTWLASLGVSRYALRSGFSSEGAMRAVVPVTLSHSADASREQSQNSVLTLRARPMLTVQSTPQVGTLDDDVSRGGVFFADAAAVPAAARPAHWRIGAFFPVHGSQSLSDNSDWIDARRLFAAEPLLSQGLGGVETTSAKPLPIPERAKAVLALVRGALHDDTGRSISMNTRAYRWLPLNAASHSIACRGRCVVLGFGDPPRAPLEPQAATWRTIPQKEVLPWLYEADVPSHTEGALHFNMAYSPNWQAFETPTHILTHVRLDTAMNGWLLRASGHARRIWVVNFAAAGVFAMELVGLVAAFLWIGRSCLERPRAVMA